MSSRGRAASPARAAAPGKTSSPAAAAAKAIARPGGRSGGASSDKMTLSTSKASRSGSSTPAGSPAGSDRLKGATGFTQKPKPSALRALRAGADDSPQPSPLGGESSNKAAKRPPVAGRARGSAGAEADAPAEASQGLTIDASQPPEDEFVPDEEEQPFVPEEDVQGSVTQGDNLMFAKARMRRQVGGPGSPASLLPGSPPPGALPGQLPSSPGASILFNPSAVQQS